MDPTAAPRRSQEPLSGPDGPVRVLLIDDDRDDYVLTKEILQDIPDGDFRLDYVATFSEGVEAVSRGEHDVYLVDYLLGAHTGIDLIEKARQAGSLGPIIIMTGKGQHDVDKAALRAGASDYLEKAGLTPTLLERSIRYAIAQYRAEAKLEKLVQDRTAALAQANDRLREADRRKDEFLAALGHELRNPLAPIRNALEIMRLKADDAAIIGTQRERLERQVGHLIRLVEDLLDISRITTGKLRIQLELVHLAEVLDAALDMSRPQFQKAQVALQVDPFPAAVQLRGDRVRLTQVFSNLLNNAAKFTEPGGSATLHVRYDADDARERKVQVRVRDTGIGIAPEQLPKIFDLFSQVSRSQTQSQVQGGLGVGLALVKHLVVMHGGTVAAQSKGANCGTEFVVTLPTC